MFSIFSSLRIFLFWRLSDALSDYLFSPPSVDYPAFDSYPNFKFDVLSLTGRGVMLMEWFLFWIDLCCSLV